MKLLAGLLTLSVAAAAAAAESPTPRDFAYGLDIEPELDRPVQQFNVPEAVYQGVTRADLGDLRVFNGGGIVVPHALCSGPVVTAETVTEQPLAVFPLRRPPPLRALGDGRVTVQTPGGTSVQVIEGSGSQALAPTVEGTDGFVVDAGGAPGALRTLRLAWNTPDGASEAQVRVEASENLNHWRTIVSGTTLLHVAADGRELDRNTIDLPQEKYRYLRLVRSEGPAVVISGVSADVVQPGAAAAPQWFAAQPAPDAEANAFLYDAGRLAPVQAARVELAMTNMALNVALDSRRSPDQAWQQRWSGDVTSVRRAAEEVAFGISDPVAAFGPVADTLWRVRVLRGAESLGGSRPTLRLGYHPARLRFLAQGDGPFVVAYGSGRVEPAQVASCEGLLPPATPEARATLIGAASATPAAAGAFGGADMLAPPPKPTPVRQIVLWAVLVLGTAALVAMALSLLRRLREDTTRPAE